VIFVDDRPGDPTPIVFVHGFSLDHRMWNAQLPAFPQRRIVRYDLRGFGRSALPTPGATYSHADDLAALLDRLQIAEADVVGLSLGGAIAIDMALLHPTRVRRLVTIGSVMAGWQWNPGAGPDFTPWRIGKTEGIEAARALWLRDPLFASVSGQARDDLFTMVRAYSGWHWANDNPTRIESPQAVDRLREVRAPTLAIVGELDLPDFHLIGRRVAAEIPGAQYVVIPGAGHMTPMEAPAAVNAALVDFLR
jgi:pimeloyl-ACP methyl ester carboxylesterase